MIDKKLIPVGGLKKEPYSGSHNGMRYYLQADDKDTFTATVYPEPWSFDKTPEEDKEQTSYPLTDEGLDLAIAWLFEMYENRKEFWLKSSNNCMQTAFKLRK